MQRAFSTSTAKRAVGKGARREYNFVKPGSQVGFLAWNPALALNLAQTPAPVDAALIKPRIDPAWPECNAAFMHPENVGNPAVFATRAQQLFKAAGIPSHLTKEFSYTFKPTTVLRQPAVALKKKLQQVEDANESFRTVLAGAPGSGKSTALLQAISYAASKNWIVLSIPDASVFVDSSTAYTYSEEDQIYHQTAAALQLLKTLHECNKEQMGALKVADGRQVNQVIAEAELHPEQANQALEIVLDALSLDTKAPFLLAIDSVQALFAPSRYPEPMTTQRIPSYALSVPRLLLSYVTGKRALSRGALIASTSSTPTAFQSPELDFKVAGRSVGAYDNLDPAYWALAQNLPIERLPDAWSRKEAAGLFEQLRGTRQLRTRVSDRAFLEKYVETGGRGAAMVYALRESMGYA